MLAVRLLPWAPPGAGGALVTASADSVLRIFALPPPAGWGEASGGAADAKAEAEAEAGGAGPRFWAEGRWRSAGEAAGTSGGGEAGGDGSAGARLLHYIVATGGGGVIALDVHPRCGGAGAEPPLVLAGCMDWSHCIVDAARGEVLQTFKDHRKWVSEFILHLRRRCFPQKGGG